MSIAAGFVGLGAMGQGMARQLHDAGLLRGVWNRSGDRARSLAHELQIEAAADPAALAAICDMIVVCVSADDDVLEVVEALRPGLRPGSVVIDCSTVSAQTARKAAGMLQDVQAEFLDAPVSGGVEGAAEGTLAIMVGGSEEAFEKAQPVLQAMGRAVTYFGSSGSGQAAKATNQIMCAGIVQSIAEAMAFAKAENLPLDKLIDTLGQGAGSSWYFVHRAPNILKGEYPAGFKVRLHDKDLGICSDMAARHGVQLPVVEATRPLYRQLIEAGHGDEDISTLFRLKDALFSEAIARGKGSSRQ